MELAINEAIIPTYTLAQSSTEGNSVFELRVSNGEFPKRKVNFLIPHRKDYYLFVLVYKGGSRHWVDATPFTLKENTFYISTPAQVHVKEKSNPLEGILFSFTEEFIALDESRLLQTLPIIQNPYNAHELALQQHDLLFIEEVMQKMITEYNSTNVWRQAMLLAHFKVLAIYLSRLYTEQFQQLYGTKERQLLLQFKQLIDEHFIEKHQVAEYAQLLHISAGYLNDLVKEQSGKTAMEHIHERMVLEAKRKLFHTELSVKEIAYQLGFEDAAYFNRFFKRLVAQTPASFRTTTREMYH
jgi:AraC family transcriptional regulator, transcriptional activator of pobA